MALAIAQMPMAQTVKEIVVSNNQAYTDHLSLGPDSRDLDLMVKVQFDEGENTLTVSLISYRMLMVFRENARYKQVVKHKRINVEALPYVAISAPSDQFVLTKPFIKMLPKDKKNFIFQRWIDVIGMQPQPQEYNMINDVVSQTFDIKPSRDIVGFTLNDIIVMERNAKKSKATRTIYDLVYWRDLDLRYQVRIERNPCFGQEQALQSAQAGVDGAQKALDALKAAYPGGVAANQEQLDAFANIHQTLVKQFPQYTGVNPCDSVNDVWDRYNQCVDTICAYECRLAENDHKSVDAQIESKGVDAKTLLSIARNIDRFTSQWVSTKDVNEKASLARQCRDMIQSAENLVKMSPLSDAEQQKAYEIFQSACKYYYSVVQNK